MTNNTCCMVFDTNYIMYTKPTPPPCCAKCTKHCSVAQIDDRLFINGWEYKNGQWKRTLRALWHWVML